MYTDVTDPVDQISTEPRTSFTAAFLLSWRGAEASRTSHPLARRAQITTPATTQQFHLKYHNDVLLSTATMYKNIPLMGPCGPNSSRRRSGRRSGRRSHDPSNNALISTSGNNIGNNSAITTSKSALAMSGCCSTRSPVSCKIMSSIFRNAQMLVTCLWLW
jgi:hypothetical protein